jgi:integrase
MEPSKVSIDSYNYSLKRLKKIMEIKEDGLDWLKDSGKVIELIDGFPYSHNYKKTFYIAIVSILKLDKNPLMDAYKVKMDEYNKKQAEIYQEQLLSPGEQEKFMDWKEILKVQRTMEKGTLDHLLVSLYTLQPPMRLDYCGMKVVTTHPEAKDGNYLVMSDKPYFIFTQYKTVKRYGVVIKEVPKPLVVVLKRYFKGYPTDILFQMSETAFSKLIGDVFEKHTTKRVTCNILRHSYVSHIKRNDKTIKEQIKLSKDMLHSVSMSDVYRRVNV